MSADELDSRLNAIEARLDAIASRQATLIDLVIGDEPQLTEERIEAMDPLRNQLEDLTEQVEQVERDVSVAIANAAKESRADGGQTSKKDVAIRNSRDELVRQVANGADAPTIVVSDVQERARPQVDLAYQTVKDAWSELATSWDAFQVVEKGEQRRLLCASARVSRELAHLVEDSLGRDGFAKRLISDRTAGEGSR